METENVETYVVFSFHNKALQPVVKPKNTENI
jgi:hypothetical protein